jgi:hypothetical protein
MIAFIFIATTITIFLQTRYNSKHLDELLKDPPKNELDEFEGILQFLSDIRIKFNI